ncbi:MAG: Rqc2 family fibronectin-binding protein [Vulcanococcus sp.]|jgi:predicted ribosome quality control (RQC) complex YloA/Tae2 family protein
MAPAAIQAMDLTSLRAVLSELQPLLVPSRFEKAQQADSHTLQLGFRTLTQRLWLELSWLAEAPRLLAIEPPPRQGDGSTLAQQLQHGLGGLALVSLEQSGWERVVELGFAARPGEAIQRWLVLELMGRHSNLFLLDEQRRVVAAARQVRQQQSRLRPIGTGDPYGPPPPLQGQPPDPNQSFERWQADLTLLPLPLLKALQSAYQGISPALAVQLTGDSPGQSDAWLSQPVDTLTPEQWRVLWGHWRGWLEALQQRRFAFSPGQCCAYRCWQTTPQASDETPRPLVINRALAAYHHDRLGNRLVLQRQHQLRQRLEQLLQRERAQMEHQQQLLDQVENSDQLQQQADALLCHPQPSRDQVAEAQALYKRARKLRRSVAAITPRLEQHRLRIEQLETSLTFLEQGPQHSHLAALEHLQTLDEECINLQEQGRPNRNQRRQHNSSTPTPLELASPSGLRLQVGRNHRQNEWISLRQARRGDLWFHAQECPGSHVVLKGSEGLSAELDLQAAADVAAHFSRARGNSRVAVVMVPCEDLQRIPGAAPGTVRHRGGAVIWAEPGRASTLLATEARSL